MVGVEKGPGVVEQENVTCIPFVDKFFLDYNTNLNFSYKLNCVFGPLMKRDNACNKIAYA